MFLRIKNISIECKLSCWSWTYTTLQSDSFLFISFSMLRASLKSETTSCNFFHNIFLPLFRLYEVNDIIYLFKLWVAVSLVMQIMSKYSYHWDSRYLLWFNLLIELIMLITDCAFYNINQINWGKHYVNFVQTFTFIIS